MTKPSPRASLNLDQIVDTALELIAKDSVDKLSMRQLSAELGASLGATYRHVPSKDALLRLCGRRLFERGYRPRSPGDDPLVWVRDQVMSLYDLLVAHPGMASHMMFMTMDVDPEMGEDVRRALVQAGHPSGNVELIGLVLTLYTSGALLASAQPWERTDYLDTRTLIATGLDYILHSYPANGVPHPDLTARSKGAKSSAAPAKKVAAANRAAATRKPR